MGKKGASSSGGGKANSRGKDQAQAAYMAKYPGRYPDSVMRQNTARPGTPAMAFTIQPARGGPIPHHNPRIHGSKHRSDAAA